VTVGAGTLFLDDRRVQNTNTPVFTMPSYWRFDLMAGYQLGPAALQMNVLNVFDKRYFVASQDSNRIFDGDPLTVFVTAKVRF
jgi:outer membrane receptor for monomeric catechols